MTQKHYAALNRNSDAIAASHRAVEGLIQFTHDNPDDPDGFYLLGNAYNDTGQPRLAMRAYLRTIELKPRFQQAHYNLGITYKRLNNRKGALDQWELLTRLDPGRAARLLRLIHNR